jgi:hypothetical protein
MADTSSPSLFDWNVSTVQSMSFAIAASSASTSASVRLP